MFFDFGAGEILGLAILAMILVGPERLPNIAVDAAKFIKRARQMATSATEELKGNLGPGFEDLKPTDLSNSLAFWMMSQHHRSQKNLPKLIPIFYDNS
jgi:sec-independent protein translocase protein TatB